MTTLRLDDLRQYSDVLRSRDGEAITVRFVEPRDAEVLQNYFRGLSSRSRYNRFFGAISELPPALLDRFIHVGEADQFSVVATMKVDGFETIVGEARYSFDFETSSFEFGLSIDDRWQGHGIGKALLKNLECRAASFGAGHIFGDTLRSNDSMIGSRPQGRLRLHQVARRLEAGALRKTYRPRAAGHSLRKLEACRCLPSCLPRCSRGLIDWSGMTFFGSSSRSIFLCFERDPTTLLDHAPGPVLRQQHRARSFFTPRMAYAPLNAGLRLSMKACTASR